MLLLDALRHKGPEQRMTLEFCHDENKYLFQEKGREAKKKNWRSFDANDLVNASYHLIGTVYMTSMGMVLNLNEEISTAISHDISKGS